MNFAIFLTVALLSMLVFERIWMHVYVRRRGRSLSFREFLIRGLYKPLFIVLAVGIYFTARDPDLFMILLVGVLAVGSIAVGYPVGRLLYPRYLATQDRSTIPPATDDP